MTFRSLASWKVECIGDLMGLGLPGMIYRLAGWAENRGKWDTILKGLKAIQIESTNKYHRVWMTFFTFINVGQNTST